MKKSAKKCHFRVIWAQFALICVVFWPLFGCQNATPDNPDYPNCHIPIKAMYTCQPIEIDGRPDEPVWDLAPAYQLYLPLDSEKGTLRPDEPGWVKLAWDEDYLYIALWLNDSDIIAEGTENHIPHFQFGDLAEIFIKNPLSACYREFYVTPAGMKTSYMLPYQAADPVVDDSVAMEVAAAVRGSLNDSSEPDIGWYAEMAIPRRLPACQPGADAGSDADNAETRLISDGWLVMAARYNYTGSLKDERIEFSASSVLPVTSFHLTEHYRPLKLAGPGGR